jgi:hypothetical protein
MSVDELKQLLLFEPIKFLDFILDDLMFINNKEIKLHGNGLMFARNIAMALDPALQKGDNVYSKTV